MQHALNLTSARWKGEPMLVADVPGDSIDLNCAKIFRLLKQKPVFVAIVHSLLSVRNVEVSFNISSNV